MTLSHLPPSEPAPFAAVLRNIFDDPSHPLQIALRTYSLCLSLCLGPALLPLAFSFVAHRKSFSARARTFWRVLSRELRPTGFASAITAAVGGGAALQRLWDVLGRRYLWAHYINSKLSSWQRAFLTNLVTSTLAVTLLRRKGRGRPGSVSTTLDLTLLSFFRALDASIQALLRCKAREIAARQDYAPLADGLALQPSDASLLDRRREELVREWQKKVATHLDALFFWAGSARIMWCFFYQPHRLPPSYVKWINSLANVNKELLEVLRAIRSGTWSYIHGASPKSDIVGHLAKGLGRPASWGDPDLLPAYGGDVANEAWKQLDVHGRSGVGGLPCELVHGGIGASFGLRDSCTTNAGIRAIYAFAEALAIYLPVHFLPTLLTRPKSIMCPHHATPALLSAVRSATFLSTFISSYWFAVCCTRTLVLARLFPMVSHDAWDGPYGCILAGSVVCGASIWIENARRRGEMALYVLPKALRASLPETWLRSRHPVVQFAECLTLVISLASLLTFSAHQPEALRGLSRWTLAFIMKGPNADLWKKQRKIATCSPAPVDPSILPLASTEYPAD